MLPTPSIEAEALSGYAAIRKLFSTEMKDVTTLIVRTLFNVIQAQFGTVHYQLLSPDEYTIRVHTDVSAYKLWRSRNGNRFPESDEWKEIIPEIQNTIIHNQNNLQRLYVPFRDSEIIIRNNSFAFEVNSEITDSSYFRDITTMIRTYLQPDFHCHLLLSKIVRHSSIVVDHEDIDRGYSMSGDQRLMLAACFENIRLMFFGAFVCMHCAQSFAQRCEFKNHIKVLILAKNNPINQIYLE